MDINLQEVVFTKGDIEFIENLVDERQEALDKKKRMPNLARATAQAEIDSLRTALSKRTLF